MEKTASRSSAVADAWYVVRQPGAGIIQEAYPDSGP